MSVNVNRGKPMHGPSLHETCSNARIERSYRTTEELVLCTADCAGHGVWFPVSECTSHIDKTRLGLNAMERIAWIVAPRGPKRQAGFVHVSEPRNEDAEIKLTLDDSD